MKTFYESQHIVVMSIQQSRVFKIWRVDKRRLIIYGQKYRSNVDTTIKYNSKFDKIMVTRILLASRGWKAFKVAINTDLLD